ncbi:MAG: serine/threonine protein kinase [Gemmataceae bacterium]|nr:serine/threonine protein kinase [Gemmataceae bacterium]
MRDEALRRHREAGDSSQMLEGMIAEGLLTRFQAKLLLEGKHKGFFLGPYKVLKPIGKGGMGVVYLAEHGELGRKVAVKVLASERVTEPGAIERFRREARAAGALDHPNIVRAHDICTVGKTHFLVMEHIDGRSLEQILRAKGRLPWHVAAGYIAQAALALQHAHERGLVHRDIKPANLLVDKAGVVKMLDLGLARFYEDRDDNLTERLGGRAIIGTPDYISPEQVLGQLDIRSDIYSLGGTLYALIEGRPPFPGGDVRSKFVAHQLHVPTPLHQRDPSVPQGLSEAVMRMLAKRPADRPQTPAEVIDLLMPWTKPPRKPPPRPVAEPKPRRSWWSWLWPWG